LLLLAAQSMVSYVPPKGYVPDADTAVKVAEAVLTPVYGKALIESEKPFRAELKDDVWTVSGTMHCENCDGGVAVVKISKTDGHIVSMIHGK
jgi:NTF2 fold immunity protein